MDRRENNQRKRDLINNWVLKGDCVLDVGCGFGGDFHKWRAKGVTCVGVDPSLESLQECHRRFPGSSLVHGTLMDVPRHLRFDVVAFNFSIQYCKPVLRETFERAHELLRRGGLIIGVVPDGERIFQDPCYTDNGDGTVTVYNPETPYYASKGPVKEPVITKADFVQASESLFTILDWSDFNQVYSKFILRRL